MAEQVKFDYSLTAGVISEDEMKAMEKITKDAKDVLVGKSGAGNDFLGWIDLPVDYDKEEFARIQKAAQKIQSDSEVLLVIGIGGSYLGARAAIEFLRHSFYNNVSKEIRKTPEIYYCGNNLNQIARKAHALGVIDAEKYDTAVMTFQQTVQALSHAILEPERRNIRKTAQW